MVLWRWQHVKCPHGRRRNCQEEVGCFAVQVLEPEVTESGEFYTVNNEIRRWSSLSEGECQRFVEDGVLNEYEVMWQVRVLFPLHFFVFNIDNGLSTRFVTHVPQRRDDWEKGFKDKVYQCHPSFVPTRSRFREGRQCFKDNVYHPCHPPTTPTLLIVATLLRSTKRGLIIQWDLSNPKSPSSGQADSPWNPLHQKTPDGDVSKCVQWRVRWIEKEKKPLRRNRNNGLNRRR